MTAPSSSTIDAPRGGAAARLALGMLWLALALAVAGAILVFVYAFVVQGAGAGWAALFIPILAVAACILAGIRALQRGRLSLAVGLTLLSTVLAAIMNFVVDLAVGEIGTTASHSAWVNGIDAVLTACFALCALSFIACVVALRRGRSGSPA